MKTNAMNVAIDNVSNVFNVDTTVTYLDCEIKITRKQEPFKYVTKTGKQATKSARYWAIVTYPDGTTETFDKVRGGAIARACGLFVRYERNARDTQGDLYEITNRRTKHK